MLSLSLSGGGQKVRERGAPLADITPRMVPLGEDSISRLTAIYVSTRARARQRDTLCTSPRLTSYIVRKSWRYINPRKRARARLRARLLRRGYHVLIAPMLYRLTCSHKQIALK